MSKKVLRKRQKRKSRMHFKMRKICREKSINRVVVYVSNRHIHAQVLDDVKQITLSSYSTLNQIIDDKIANASKKNFANKKNAKIVGERLAKKISDLGLSKFAFDRGLKKYHGIVAEVFDSFRSIASC